MNRNLNIEQRTAMLNSLADDEDPLGILAAAGVPQPVLVELLERDYAAAHPPKVHPPEPDFETGSLDRKSNELGGDVIGRVECVIDLLEETLEYIRGVDYQMYPDEQIIMRSVATDLQRHVIGGIWNRQEANIPGERDESREPPDYHYDRFDDFEEEPVI